MSLLSSIDSIKERAKMKTILDKISWKTLLILLGIMIAIRLMLRFN